MKTVCKLGKKAVKGIFGGQEMNKEKLHGKEAIKLSEKWKS